MRVLQDISGKPLQTALLATSSSGVTSKDCPMHSNSERSLNSPVMSGHCSTQSGSGLSGGGAVGQNGGRPKSHGLLADAVAQSGGGGGGGRPPAGVADEQALLHRRHHHQQQQHVRLEQGVGVGGADDDTGSCSTSSDESGNDSFTCSEIEYDNNSVSGEKLSDVIFNKSGKSASGSSDRDSQRRRRLPLPLPSPPPLPPIGAADELHAAKQASAHHQQHHQHQQQHQDDRRRGQEPAGYDAFDSSFRGSLSTLMASDDDGPMYRGNVRTPNNASESSSIPVGLGWDYLLSWAPPSNNGVRPPSMMQQQQQQQHHPPPPYGERDPDGGYRRRRRSAQTPPGTVGGDGSSSRSSSRQSPKSPEEYV